MNHPELERLAKEGLYEIVKYPAYFSDEMVMSMLRTNTNPNVIYYITLVHGIIPIMTIGNYKSFVTKLGTQPIPAIIPEPSL